MLHDVIDNIVAQARTKGWSQAELALRAGLTPETASRAKKGCNFSTIERLASAAGLKLVVVPADNYVERAILGQSLPGER